MVALNFDATTVPESDRNFDPVPADNYTMQVTSTEVKNTKRGDGIILSVVSQIMEGPYANRLVFDNINLENPSEKAVEIGKRQLADLCLAVGLNACADSEELHFKPFTGRVGVRPADGQYGPQNTIRYKSRGGVVEMAPQQAPKAAPTAAPVAKPNGQRAWQAPRPRV